jgi:lysophospholipase L1-like esterase
METKFMKRKVIKIELLGLASIIILCFSFFGFKAYIPKVFVIGDSISMHYGPYLEKSLAGFFVYDRKRGSENSLDDPNGSNGGDSNMVVSYLKELKGNPNFKTDYLLINCGLHDIKRNSRNSNPQVSLDQYSKNIIEIISISKEVGAKLIWINSTPVVDSIHNSKAEFIRYDEDVIKYNNESAKIMTEMGVPVIDIYTFTKKFIPKGYVDHVHFNNEVRQKQADFIAENLVTIKYK